MEQRTILVVDEPTSRRTFERWMTAVGYAVVEAGSAAEALEMLVMLPDRVDLMLIEQRLPEGSGDELIDYVRKTRPALPILCITADVQGCAPRVPFVAKPMSRESLIEAVRSTWGATFEATAT